MSQSGDIARSASSSFVNSKAFAALSRLGFVARGVVYGIIGLLALDLAVGHGGGMITNQQGALRVIEQRHYGHLLLLIVAVGLGGYSLWRLFRAALGHGPEGTDKGIERVGGLGSGVVYAAMCALAIRLLTGSSGSTGSPKKSTAGVFGWPGGRLLVGAVGVVMIGVAVYQLIRGVRKKFLDDSKTERMRALVREWFTRLGVVGHLARAVVFGLVGSFLLKAAIDHRAGEAIGLDGALSKLYRHSYGPWLLGAVAVGLIAFGLFSIIESRFRRI